MSVRGTGMDDRGSRRLVDADGDERIAVATRVRQAGRQENANRYGMLLAILLALIGALAVYRLFA